MPLAIRLKKSLTKPKRLKGTTNSVSSSGHEAELRPEGENRHFDRERNEREVDTKGRSRSKLVRPKWRRADGSAVEPMSGRYSDEGHSRRKPVYANRRKIEGDDSDIEPRIGREAHALRVSNGKKEDNHGGRDSRSFSMEEKQARRDVSIGKEGKYSDVGLNRRNPSYSKQRKFEQDDSGIETSDGEARAPSGHREKDDDNHGGKERRSSAMEGKPTRKGVMVSMEGEYNNTRRSQRKLSNAKQVGFDKDNIDIKRTNEEVRSLRGRRGKKDDSRGEQDFRRNERRGGNIEVPAGNLKSNGKKNDRFMYTEKVKDDAQVKLLEKYADRKDGSNNIAAEKLNIRQSRLLDKPGKGITSRKKSSGVEPPENSVPPKKRKRIKIDPYDMSNKRLDDVVLENG